jgi:hypothetical protein
MRKVVLLVGVLALLPLHISARAHDDDETLVTRFDGGIGVTPVIVSGGPTTFTLAQNVVRGITPAGLPWVIDGLKAKLETDGDFHAKGHGLVLAAGASIGTRGGVSTVRALLFCDGSATAHVSGPAALDSDGDFHIEGFLTPAVGLTCPTPTLLIAIGDGSTTAPFRWLAAGIPDNDDHDNN